MRRSMFLAILFLVVAVLPVVAQTEPDLTISEFAEKIERSRSPQILDVRTEEEFAENHLESAINLPLKDSVAFIHAVSRLTKSSPVFVYSINNGRSAVAQRKLQSLGFVEVYQMPGGIARWLGAGLPVVSSRKDVISIAGLRNVVSREKTVLVSVGSKYCGGCRKLAPVVDDVVKQNGPELEFVKIELYDNRDVARELAIEAVPSLILFRDNKEVWRKSGNISREEIQAAINEL